MERTHSTTSLLTLHRKQTCKLAIPYWLFINGQPIGIMQKREVCVHLPKGTWELGVRIVFRFFKWQFSIGGNRKVSLSDGMHLHLHITNKERWWNLLFDIDLAFWLAEFFMELPHPWNIIYQIASNGFFFLWLARIWYIRNKYFQIIER